MHASGRDISRQDLRGAPDRASQEPVVVRFGPFQADGVARQLTRDGHRIPIQRKPLDVLLHLATHAGRVVTRVELLDVHWAGVVHDEALTRCVSAVRRALGDTHEPPRYIETVWGEGYRFVEPVVIATAPAIRVADERNDGPAAVGRAPDEADAADGAASAPRHGAADPRAALARLAVWPMTPQSDADRWLARSLTDHLARTLARIEGLTVVTHSGASSDDDRGTPPPREADPCVVGRLLGVGALLTSRLARSGERIDLSASLIATGDGSVLWALALPPMSADPGPEMVEQLAAAVARRLWARLQLDRSEAAVDPAAYRHYLRGRYYWSQRSATGLREAIAAFEQALELQPEYADAQVGLAEAWLLLPLYGAAPPVEAIPRARRAAARALAIDRRSARALAVRGVIAMQHDWDWMGAETLLRQALTLEPNDATTEQWLGELCAYRHRFDEARDHLRSAAALDPLSPVLRMMQASPALFAGDFDAAVDAYRRALTEAPDFAMGWHALGLAHAGRGDWASAIDAYRRAQPELGLAIVGGPLAFALARGGRRAPARALLLRLEQLGTQRYVPPVKFATACVGLGDGDGALRWLRHAVEQHDDRLLYLAVDAHFRELHRDPGFRAVARRVGLLDLIGPR
jgi:DNA-binding winged helix-turn-helix (wHTH) protein/tetratricopeptide (TPR) repeat protein